jgi:hypothetical protein
MTFIKNMEAILMQILIIVKIFLQICLRGYIYISREGINKGSFWAPLIKEGWDI